MESFPKQEQTPADSETRDKYEAISKAQSFEELLTVIDQLGSIEGSRGKLYTAEKLKEKINLVRDGAGIFLEGITKTGGLKSKVMELLSKEVDKDEE